MAFKPRNKNNGIERVDEVGSDLETSKNTHSKFVQERNTYREEAIKVLNILDSQGINIYDENRKPGMYLKKGNGNKKIIDFLGSKTNRDQPTQLDNQPTEKIPESLLNFFAKKQTDK